MPRRSLEAAVRRMESLPRPAPDDPLPLARRWLEDALSDSRINPWAMALASAGADGRPSVRYVLLKDLSEAGGFIVFYTNYASRKAMELEASGRGAGALYWSEAGRQLRFEGRIERSPETESDTYFATRPRSSQLNAWASEQSRPIEAPEAMASRLAARERDFAPGRVIPRPAGWGGYRLYLDTVEFWVAGQDRFHERLSFTRAAGGAWSGVWLQP